MVSSKNLTSTSARIAAGAVALLAMSGCGQSSSDDSASDSCETYPTKDVSFVVPYSAGGGFDAWARLIAPHLEEVLGGDGAIRVENVPGGGGMRAANELFAGPTDGTKIQLSEPGYTAVEQVMGRTSDEFDISKFTYLAQVTEDPQVLSVAPDSEFDSVEDFSGKSIKHASQDAAPAELLTYAAYGIDASYVLHEGTAESILSVVRGDTDAFMSSITGSLEYLKSGKLKPVLYVGTEIEEGVPGYEELKDAPTADETGHPELREAITQYRVVMAPPELEPCIKDKLDGALAEVLADPEFLQEAEDANLRVVAGDASAAEERAVSLLEAYEENADVLKKGLK